MRKDVEKNNIDEKILELGKMTWTYDEKQETLEKIKNTPTKRNLPVKYYLAIASVCLLTLIIISPMLLQFRVDNTTAKLVDLCGWDPNRTNIVLEDNYTHPIPCIQPVLGPTSMIMIQSSREGEEFLYREMEENNPEQVVSVAIVGNDSKITDAKYSIKETADYDIFEQTQVSNGEEDVSIVAEGSVNEELNFQISFHDRNGDYKLEEIVSKIEGIINDIRRNQ
ncbi:hypothetical protein RJD24_10935 [Bacillaceae bacterium IKA-2]|nr:hypothetical protein RJD24_10935 [Bacillaceae bacterium IKA-2]